MLYVETAGSQKTGAQHNAYVAVSEAANEERWPLRVQVPKYRVSTPTHDYDS